MPLDWLDIQSENIPDSPAPAMLMVYGSLMRCSNHGNGSLLSGATFIGYGHTEASPPHGHSRFRMFDNGAFPYVVRDPAKYGYLIWGELYKDIPQQDWNYIKRMEEGAGYKLEEVGAFYHYAGNRWIYGAKMWVYQNMQYARQFQEVQSGSWRNLAMQGGRA